MQSYVRAISEGKNGSHISGISTVALADALIDSWFFGGSKEETLIQNPEANSEILEPLGITMEIMKMKLSELRPAQYNPRKALRPGDPAYEKLKNSILTFGNVEPIVWNRTTGNVVGGHQRLSVLLDLGVEESEVSVVDLTEVEEKQLNIALNKITGEWDEEKLVILLSDITGEGADATVTGFDEMELELLFAELADADPAEDNFDVEAELQKPPITKSGDLWLLGQHRLVCGDSTKKETFDLLMDGKLANLVVTDPPYNVDYEGVAGKFKNDHMASEAFYTFLLAAFQNTEAAMAQDASIYVFHGYTPERAFTTDYPAEFVAPFAAGRSVYISQTGGDER